MAEGASETRYHTHPEKQFGTSACPPQTGVWGEKRLRVSDAFNTIVASETQYHNRPETQFGTSIRPKFQFGAEIGFASPTHLPYFYPKRPYNALLRNPTPVFPYFPTRRRR